MKYLIEKLRKKYYNSKIKKHNQIEGYLQSDEALNLYLLAKSLPLNSRIIEIGSWKGKSTYCLAKGLMSGTIFAIDPFNADGDDEAKISYQAKIGSFSLEQQFCNNLLIDEVINKVTICKGYSFDFVNKIESADFIFIDGDHSISGCEYDFLNFYPKLIGSKLIAFHDYYPERPELGPTFVINKYILNNPSWKVIKIVDSLFVAQKI